jgi:branched-chain amino acid transport system ATP-binding protein
MPKGPMPDGTMPERAMPGRPMLQVAGLTSGYGRITILNGVALSVAAGEFMGVLGHNGMGKTTLLRTLTGLVPATAGQITFDGHDITNRPTYARTRLGIGYVPQGRQIFPDLTVRENMLMGCAKSADDPRRTTDRVLALFPRLTRLLERRGGGLSGGEQQLLALARCFCGGPKMLLLDEPTEGIQPSIIDEIVDTLRMISRTQGVTIVVVEQNLEFLVELVSRIVVLQRGRVRDEITGERMHDVASLAEALM